jgi:hypothetical protein
MVLHTTVEKVVANNELSMHFVQITYVPRYDRVHGVIPLILDAVQVRVTDSTVQNFYRYIIISGAPASLMDIVDNSARVTIYSDSTI